MKTLQNLLEEAKEKVKRYRKTGVEDTYELRQFEKWEDRVWKLEFEIIKIYNKFNDKI